MTNYTDLESDILLDYKNNTAQEIGESYLHDYSAEEHLTLLLLTKDKDGRVFSKQVDRCLSFLELFRGEVKEINGRDNLYEFKVVDFEMEYFVSFDIASELMADHETVDFHAVSYGLHAPGLNAETIEYMEFLLKQDLAEFADIAKK